MNFFTDFLCQNSSFSSVRNTQLWVPNSNSTKHIDVTGNRTFENTTFSMCSAQGRDGGAINWNNDGQLHILSCSFNRCTAMPSLNGGAVFAGKQSNDSVFGSILVKDVLMSDGDAKEGGGMFLSSLVQIQITNTRFSVLYAGIDGGCMCLCDIYTAATIVDCVMELCSCTHTGMAIEGALIKSLEISDTTVSDMEVRATVAPFHDIGGSISLNVKYSVNTTLCRVFFIENVIDAPFDTSSMARDLLLTPHMNDTDIRKMVDACYSTSYFPHCINKLDNAVTEVKGLFTTPSNSITISLPSNPRPSDSDADDQQDWDTYAENSVSCLIGAVDCRSMSYAVSSCKNGDINMRRINIGQGWMDEHEVNVKNKTVQISGVIGQTDRVSTVLYNTKRTLNDQRRPVFCLTNGCLTLDNMVFVMSLIATADSSVPQLIEVTPVVGGIQGAVAISNVKLRMIDLINDFTPIRTNANTTIEYVNTAMLISTTRSNMTMMNVSFEPFSNENGVIHVPRFQNDFFQHITSDLAISLTFYNVRMDQCRLNDCSLINIKKPNVSTSSAHLSVIFRDCFFCRIINTHDMACVFNVEHDYAHPAQIEMKMSHTWFESCETDIPFEGDVVSLFHVSISMNMGGFSGDNCGLFWKRHRNTLGHSIQASLPLLPNSKPKIPSRRHRNTAELCVSEGSVLHIGNSQVDMFNLTFDGCISTAISIEGTSSTLNLTSCSFILNGLYERFAVLPEGPLYQFNIDCYNKSTVDITSLQKIDRFTVQFPFDNTSFWFFNSDCTVNSHLRSDLSIPSFTVIPTISTVSSHKENSSLVILMDGTNFYPCRLYAEVFEAIPASHTHTSIVENTSYFCLPDLFPNGSIKISIPTKLLSRQAWFVRLHFHDGLTYTPALVHSEPVTRDRLEQHLSHYSHTEYTEVLQAQKSMAPVVATLSVLLSLTFVTLFATFGLAMRYRIKLSQTVHKREQVRLLGNSRS